MDKNRLVLESLSSDLKRVSLGLQRKSLNMANRFSKEAQKRVKEVRESDTAPYISKIISQLVKHLNKDFSDRSAEDMLMYSVILQNYCFKKLA